jgi:hypothetical protein
MNHTINITDAQIRSLIACAKEDLASAEMCLSVDPHSAATCLRAATGFSNIAAVLLTRAMEGK